MTLYEIDAQLEEMLEQVDPETGELLCDMEQLEALSLERDRKLENLALYIKNRDAEAKAIREEEESPGRPQARPGAEGGAGAGLPGQDAGRREVHHAEGGRQLAEV